ncbi:putative flavin-containing monoamine oxidase AofH [Nocardia neocaledoniensis NBRC 108232]|uniref:Monoamine oxidase n=1 Tax=Nocardia neocaledoniensis TaxID=236511 RepID=A0A317N1I4_9NOCA|nr:FAD-dependent oxidoreductase [Nocardia neocaledoniensis]PWV67754.1 monoamine oxidase [Nocardia neocaledoniensis]GEM31026.1 putative flavin-containing monoamine oxidase AofH [Nocardia neocaledoniensis NBRC 108232]
MTEQTVNDPAAGGPPPRTVPVIVVGAGVAGLVAARELRGHGIEVVVLEAAERPGGRTLAETTVLGSRVDLGGQWIGRGHHRAEALAAELGLTVFPMRTPARPAIVDGATPVGRRPAVAVATAALLLCEILARVGAPRSLTAGSVGSWLRRLPSRRARRLLEVFVSESTTADLDNYAMHALLAAIRYQGGLAAMLATAGGAQENLVVEGLGTAAERLAADLGDRVVLGTPVTALHRDDTGVTVRTAWGDYRAERVIVTVAPPKAATIEHRPAAPASRIRLQDNTCMGSVYKAVAVYDRPFWRARGEAESVLLSEPGTAVFDTSPPEGPGHLCMLVGGREARALDDLDDHARRAAVLGPVAEHLGPGVLAPRGWHEKSWHRDPYVGGGYSALPRLGDETGYFPMPAAPMGRVHWAGTETAAEHAGYVEGAIESGERAAREVAAFLVPNSTDR